MTDTREPPEHSHRPVIGGDGPTRARRAGLEALLTSGEMDRLAVSATFRRDILETPVGDDVLDIVSDRLVGAAPAPGLPVEPERILKEQVRVDHLARMIRRGGPEALLGARRQLGAVASSALQDALDRALSDEDTPVEHLDEDSLIAVLRVGRWFRALEAVTGVPTGGSGRFRTDVIEARLRLLETLQPVRAATADGCFGREPELQQLHQHLEGPGRGVTLHQHPAMSVYGIGGVGKSTLVARFVLDIAESRSERWAWAYLDLDRPSLSAFTPETLCRDILRQVGTQLPEGARSLRYQSEQAQYITKGRGLESRRGDQGWFDGIRRLADLVNRALDGRLVVIVDTFEEMERRDAGAEMSVDLARMFTTLSDAVGWFRLVVSGRAPTGVFAPDRSRVSSSASEHYQLQVRAFETETAVDVLRKLHRAEVGRRAQREGAAEMDPDLARRLVEEFGGSPLTLKLVARVVADETGATPLTGVSPHHTVDRVRDEFVQGFLYRRILGHMVAPRRELTQTLRDMARASLPLRFVTSDLIRTVLFPAIGSPEADPDELLEAVRRETGFVAQDSAAGLRLRDELRAPALQALSLEDPDLVGTVHRAAAEYYRDHADLPGAEVELLYHQLASGSHPDPAGTDPESLRRVGDRSLAGLPHSGRRTLEEALDHATLDALAGRGPLEDRIYAGAATALDDGRVDDAAELLADPTTWRDTTALHELVARLHEARGDVAGAIDAAACDVEAARLSEDPERLGAAAVGHARLLERASGGAAAAPVLYAAEATSWLRPHTAVRLELQLNALAALERGRDRTDRWVGELDARSLLQRLPPTEVASNPALVRLLAATLGRDEPRLVLDAARTIGLGTTTYSTHFHNLATVLADWDLMDHGGALAHDLNLSVDSSSSSDLREAWFRSVASWGSDAPRFVDRIVSRGTPPRDVSEALRAFYLWWGLDPQDTAFPDSGPGPGDGGEAASPVTGHQSARLVEALVGAYHETTLLHLLATRAGGDVEAIDWSQPLRGVALQIVTDAVDRDGAAALVGAALEDPAASAFHDAIREAASPSAT